MNGENLDKKLREKLAEKQYVYKDEYWVGAKQFIDQQNDSGRNRGFLWFALVALPLIGGAICLIPSSESLRQSLTYSPRITSSIELAPLIASQSDFAALNSGIHNTQIATSKPTTVKENLSDNKQSTSRKKQSSTLPKEYEIDHAVASSSASSIYISTRATDEFISEPEANSLSATTMSESATMINIASTELTYTSVNVNEFATTKSRAFEARLDSLLPFGLATQLDQQAPILLKKKFSPAKASKLSIGLYSQFYLPSTFTEDQYKLKEHSFWSAGALLSYPLTNSVAVSGGIGLQQQVTQLSLVTSKTSTSTDFVVDANNIPVITTSEEWQYEFRFSSGVPVFIDSNLITITDTTFIVEYDTTEIVTVDTNTSSHSANYRFNWIEVPLYLSYSKQLGRWDVFGAVGLHANYLASITVDNSSADAPLPDKNQIRTVALDGSVQLGVSYYISTHLKANLAPTFRTNLTRRYDFVDNRNMYYGLTFGLFYKL